MSGLIRGAWYYGVECEECHQFIGLNLDTANGMGDPIHFLPYREQRTTFNHPCPHCSHRGTYEHDAVIRRRVPRSGE